MQLLKLLLLIDKGNHYVINGTKNWITNGGRSDVYLVIAQTDRSKKGHQRELMPLLLKKVWKDLYIGPKEDKLGIRGSDTHTLTI